jgi:IS30 family transposase
MDIRACFGDCEIDTIFGKYHRQTLITLVEYKSRRMLITKIILKLLKLCTLKLYVY